MATYSPGETEDDVIKTTDISQDLDLTVWKQQFTYLKNALQAIPNSKSTCDQETLDHWMNTVYVEGQEDKIRFDEEAVLMYEEITAIKNAGLLPSKYDDEYQQLEDYVNSLP